jgi:hypothetical protein
MPYALKMTISAKKALKKCFETYHQEEEISSWLKRLVALAEAGIGDGSIDLGDMFRNLGIDMPDPEDFDPDDWRSSWIYFKDAELRKKIQFLIVIAAKRNPPIQLRHATETFVFLGAIWLDVSANYEINHVEKVVLFRTFEGLPGTGLPDT